MDRIVIRPVGESWEDVNWDDEGHQTYVNHELGMFYHLLYLSMVTVAGKRIVARSWTHWALKPYVDQGTFQDGVAKLFYVSLLAIFLDFTYFLLCCATLILSCKLKHFHLAEGVSSEAANIVFDKVAQKVIKDVIKHARLVSTALYYTKVMYHSL
jgi:hypothetical protein